MNTPNLLDYWEGQLREVMDISSSVIEGVIEIEEKLKSGQASGELTEILKQITWAELYEMPADHLFIWVGEAMGINRKSADAIAEGPEASDKFNRDFLKNARDEVAELDSRFSKSDGLELYFAAARSFHAKRVYGRYMGELVEDVRANSDWAFFNAIRIDRSVVGCPTFLKRISFAEACKDEDFLARLGRTMVEPRRPWRVLKGDLRYSLAVLNDKGAIQQLGSDGLFELLQVRLGIYSDKPDPDADSLWTFAKRWLKRQSTKSPEKMSSTPEA